VEVDRLCREMEQSLVMRNELLGRLDDNVQSGMYNIYTAYGMHDQCLPTCSVPLADGFETRSSTVIFNIYYN
jgi:hypothetical protein